jgi:dipeptidyl aminopeptidase/acylaminoacyl peptidase
MKKAFLIIITVLCYLFGCGQPKNAKLPLDKESYENWPSIRDAAISNNGQYITYFIGRPNGASLVVTNSSRSKKKKFNTVWSASFSSDSKELYFVQGSDMDSLFVFNTKTFNTSFISKVVEFRLAKYGSNEFIIYQTKTISKLFIKNLKTEEESSISDVKSFLLSENCKAVLVTKKNENDHSGKFILIWKDLETTKQFNIWNGQEPIAFSFSPDANKSAFLVEGSGNVKANRKLYVCSPGKGATQLPLSGSDSTFISESNLKFNRSGELLLFSENKIENLPEIKEMAAVDVWNYKDQYLQPRQLKSSFEDLYKINIEFAYDLINDRIIVLTKENESISNSNPNKYLLIHSRYSADSYYNAKHLPSLDIISIGKGNRQNILEKGVNDFLFEHISPDEKFVIWYNLDEKSWFSFDTATGKIFNLSNFVSAPFFDEEALNIGRNGTWDFASWITSENSVLLYDRYDIWKVSLDNTNPPINLTSGFGRKNRVILTVETNEDESRTLSQDAEVIISGYSLENKTGGYFRGRLNNLQMNRLQLGQYSVNSRMPIGFYGKAPGRIIKSKDAKSCLIERETAESSPNVYLTKDFNTYKSISNFHPENKYNWMKAELVTWKMLDGKVSQGILYKPGNFNPSFKYPVIFNYYEKRSDELYEFIKPQYSPNNINIPAFVDNGYLVFIPDIYSNPGKNGEGSYNAIESAARYLIKLPYVDSTKLGLQGHSYGGWQTNYMITHSKRFAAACEAAGQSDQISGYGQLVGGTGSRADHYEINLQGSPYGVGITPWTRKDLYINNSPVFKINEISTPLLMMHNKNDGAVPFEQAVEMFTDMKRAGKKVWMLQYDNQGHSLVGKAALDYHLRMLQFFDHYLKGKPAPIWMTKGVPAYLKGREDGFEIDTADLSSNN